MTQDEWPEPIECPRCGKKTGVEICYGMVPDPYLKAAEEGKIIIGGCIIIRDAPKWHCAACKHEWGRTSHYSD